MNLAEDQVMVPVPAVAEALAAVAQMVRGNINRWRRLVLLQSAALVVAVPLAYFWLALVADNRFHMPRWARLLVAFGFVVVTAALIWSQRRRWQLLRLSEDEVALAIEQRTPGGIRNRLINAVQLSREGAVEGAVSAAVVRHNYEELRDMPLPAAARSTKAWSCVGLAVLAMVIGGILQHVEPEQFGNSTRRLLLPLAEIAPVYRTWLEVSPGHVKAAGDVTIRVKIHGERPARVTVFRVANGVRTSETAAVPRGGDEVLYTFRNLRENLDYSVRGNDFTSPYYRITVNTAAELSRLRAKLVLPEYTHLAARELESTSGDLEALLGSKAELVFVLDRPVANASLLIQGVSAVTDAVTRVALTRRSETEFAGALTFRDVQGYRLETKVPGGTVQPGKLRALRVLADAEPKPELVGLERETEVAPEAQVALKLTAHDDIGLGQVGLFMRRVESGAAAATNPADKSGAGGWTAVKVWPGEGRTQFAQDLPFSVAALGAAEGERFELQARAADNDPVKAGTWVSGPTHVLIVGGEGTGLQLVYEQILRTERELTALVAAEEGLMGRAVDWMRKFDPASGLRWDDAKTIESLAAEMKDQAKAQEQIRQTAGAIARSMVPAAGDLRLSVGLLADTEMVRVIQMLESVAGREDPQAKRSTLGDGRLTEERTLRSLREIFEQYRAFRQDWELANMIGFTGMLADREKRLRDQSARLVQTPANATPALAEATSRRQAKVLELAGLASQAFGGLTRRTADVEPVMIAAFGAASTALAGAELKAALQQASDLAKAGSWAAAGDKQAVAAKTLEEIVGALKKAQADIAKALLAQLAEAAKSSLEAQAELERLKAGTNESMMAMQNLKPEEIQHMRDALNKGDKNKATEGFDADKLFGAFSESIRAMMQTTAGDKRQQLKNMSLASTPTGYAKGASFSDLPPNKVNALTQEKVDDLIGKLLDEADIMEKQFDTFTITMAVTTDEKGDVGKLSGRLNSTAASAATGNQKPPPANVGGASRMGRQGARSFGATMSTEGENMRGRDKVQEGQERAPDQAGVIKERNSADPQKDTSTGWGGKKVETDDPNTFNVSDAGKFDNAVLGKMGPAKEKGAIVERQDGRVASNLGDLMRDMTSTQQQVVERLKAIRKELKNLYLPTDQIDELLSQWTANMARLKESPDPEAFRLQQQTLDKVRSAMRVFGGAQTGFQPSLPRDQAVRGKVLDEAPRQVLPGYEDVVKTYYELLSAPGGGVPSAAAGRP